MRRNGASARSRSNLSNYQTSAVEFSPTWVERKSQPRADPGTFFLVADGSGHAGLAADSARLKTVVRHKSGFGELSSATVVYQASVR